MASVNKDLKYTAFGGSNIPLPQHENKNGDMVLSGENNPLPTQLTGSKVEQLISEYTDINGKVNGQTYDVPHHIIPSANSIVDSPAEMLTKPEFPTGGYKKVYSLNGQTASNSTTNNGNYALCFIDWDVLSVLKRTHSSDKNMSVEDLKGLILQLNPKVFGYGDGVGGNGLSIKAYNHTANAWDNVGSNVASSVLETSATVSSNYISDDGHLYIMAHSTNTSDGVTSASVFLDYVSLEIKALGANINTSSSIDARKSSLKVDAVANDTVPASDTGYFVLNNIDWAVDGSLWVSANQSFQLFAWALDDPSHDQRDLSNSVELTTGEVTTTDTGIYYRYRITDLLPCKTISVGMQNNSTSSMNYNLSYMVTAL